MTETAEREEQYTTYKPVVETSYQEQQYAVQRPVVETQYQTQRYTVQRPVVQTQYQTQQYTSMRPVTTMQTQTVDQGGYVAQQVVQPGRIFLGSAPVLADEDKPQHPLERVLFRHEVPETAMPTQATPGPDVNIDLGVLISATYTGV